MNKAPDLASERGAILVGALLTLLVLIGIAAYVVDYGVLWVARHQAQNAADAGAIAGAIARAYDDFDDPPDAAGAAISSASQAATANVVWGQAAAVPPPSTACPSEVGASGRCVRVDVYRDAGHSNALPTVFAPIWTLLLPPVVQNVRATASARVAVSNGTDCLRPWAIPDKWSGPSYLAGTPYTPADTYTPPSPVGPGTGLVFPTSNAGVPLSDLDKSIGPLTFDDLTGLPANSTRRTSVVPLELDGGYFPSRDACNHQLVRVGDQVPISTSPAVAAAPDLDALPPDLVSPRLVALAVFDVEAFRFQKSIGWTGCPTSGIACVRVVNIVGFVIGAGGTSGVVSSYPGLIPTDPLEAPSLSAASSFLKAVTLVR